MSKIVFVGGTHGCGKSTLAMTIIRRHGGFLCEYTIAGTPITVAYDGTAVLGSYKNSCGGLDTLKNWNSIIDAVSVLTSKNCPRILGEGMIKYSYKKYIELSNIYKQNFMFINLHTNINQCIENVYKRRQSNGNGTLFNHSNVFKGEKSWYGIYLSLLENNVPNVFRLDFDDAYNIIENFWKET